MVHRDLLAQPGRQRRAVPASRRPVVVQGRLEMRKYVNSQDVEVEALEIDATAVGHDLARGTSQFTRSPRQEPVTAGTERAPAA